MAKFDMYEQLMQEASGYSFSQASKDTKALANNKSGLAMTELNKVYNEYNAMINKAPISLQKTLHPLLDKYKGIAEAAITKSASDGSVKNALNRFTTLCETKIAKRIQNVKDEDKK